MAFESMRCRRSIVAVALGLFAGAAAAAPEILRTSGQAYDLESGRLLYTEQHEQHRETGRNLDGTVTYFDPQGKQIAAKTVDYRNDPFVPVFRLEIPEQGYMESITDNRDAIVMARKRRGEAERIEREDKTQPIAADAGLHQFITANLPALRDGAKLKLRLAVAGHLDIYSVRVRRDSKVNPGNSGNPGELAGRPALRIVVEHDSVLSFVLDPVELIYDRETRHLLEYRGISNQRDPATGDAYKVRIVYQAHSAP